MANPIKKISKKFKKITNSFLEGDFFGLAAQVSFYLLSAFFPMLILVFIVVSSVSLNYTDALLKVLAALPDRSESLIVNMLANRTRSVAIVSITGALSLSTMSGFILTLGKGLNRFFGVEENRNPFKNRLLAILFAFLVFLSVILSFGLIIFGRIIGLMILKHTMRTGIIVLWNISRYLLLLIFIALIISAIFKVMPSIKLKLRHVFPGAAFSTLAWYASSMLFALYVNNFPQYEIIYGSLAGFVCMMVWIYMTGIILLSGAKINALLYKKKQRLV